MAAYRVLARRGWTFILWGIYFGVILLIERFFLHEFIEKYRVIGHVYTIIIFIFGWVIFRAESIAHIGEITASMLGANGTGSFTWLAEQDIVQIPYLIAIIAGIICSMPISRYLSDILNTTVSGRALIDVATVAALAYLYLRACRRLLQPIYLFYFLINHRQEKFQVGAPDLKFRSPVELLQVFLRLHLMKPER